MDDYSGPDCICLRDSDSKFMAGRLRLDNGVCRRDSGYDIVGGSNDVSRCHFEKLLDQCLSETYGLNRFQSYHPTLSDGKNVDLYKLFLVVREKGGYNAVLDGKLWNLVGEKTGLGVGVGPSVKLVYGKYLSALDSWMKKVDESNVSAKRGEVDDMDKFRRCLRELQADVEGLLSSNIEDKVVTREEVKGGLADDDEKLDGRKLYGANNVMKGYILDLNGNENGVCSNLEVSNRDMNLVIENVGEGNEPNRDEGDRNRGCPDSEVPDREVNESVANSGEGYDATEVEEEFDVEKISVEESVDVLHAKFNNVIELLSGGEKGGVNNAKDLIFDPSGGGGGGSGNSDSSSRKRKKESMLDSSGGDNDSSGRKRTTESTLGVLSWVRGVAKNPCDLVAGLILENPKWKSYSNKEVRKQVLLFREAIFHKRGVEPSWQSQKMHPCLYDDDTGTNYNRRDKLKRDKKLLFGNSTSSAQRFLDSSAGTENRTPSPHIEDSSKKRMRNSSYADSIFNKCAIISIPIGKKHQAEIPEWTSVTFESDSKWLGIQIWPPPTVNNKLLIEGDPIGKGRQDSCGCAIPSSVECVRFHVSKKRAKVALELGATFYDWNFDKVGEYLSLLWKKDEEKRFEDAVRSNPLAPKDYFWDYVFWAFPTKSMANLVSYYYNVFILRRRAYQNRHTPNEIDSDDDACTKRRTVVGHHIYNSRRR